MQENSKYAVGLDIGTSTVRAVVAHVDTSNGTPTIVGVGTAVNSGMRKGMVNNLSGPAKAMDEALAAAEKMSGYQVNTATISVNGRNILSTHAEGMIASSSDEISPGDVDRLIDMATTGKVPANREILDVVPHTYRLDGQDNIKDPVGMTGTRLEIDAHVVSILAPDLDNLRKSADMAGVSARNIITTAAAAEHGVLSEQQMETGVALIDIGAATTGVSVYEEGDLQYTSVLPYGGANITNDLAIGLKTDPEVAEQVKLKHAHAGTRAKNEKITMKHGGESYTFETDEIDEIVEARLEDIYEAIQKELKKAGYNAKLPSGIVLVGGTAKLKGIVEYTKETLGLAARIGKTSGYGGVADNVDSPDFAVAVGLMLIDSEGAPTKKDKKQRKTSGIISNITGVLGKAFGKSE